MKHTPSNLRERRRLQTAREIQLATLQLVRRHGFSQLTTEMIADAAGISLRTFFNYYPNKEAALVGPPVLIDGAALARFAAGHGSLIEDFAALSLKQFETASGRQAVRAISDVVRLHAELEHAFAGTLAALRNQLTRALAARLGRDDAATGLLTEILTTALTRAFLDWGNDDTLTAEAAVRAMTDRLAMVGMALLDRPAAVPE